MQETWVPSLGWEDPLEEGMATHSSILAWTISMGRGSWRATVHGVTKSRTQLKRLCSSSSSRVIQASLVAQKVKSLPAMQETWVQSLGWEDPLEEGMATHSSILA